MLRSSHLPPRYPFQKKVPAHQNLEPGSISPPKANEPRTRRQHNQYSKNSSLDDQPEWLDDLLTDSDSSPKGNSLSAAESLTSFHGLVPNRVLWQSKDEGKLCYEEGYYPLESECMYGPNSPRHNCNVMFEERSMLLALSDSVDDAPMQMPLLDEVTLRNSDCQPNGDCYCSPNELNADSKPGKRHPGQRSRARKLQYIAELEKTVNSFQALESEMAIKYSTLLQKRVALSVENSELKQKMARLQHQKLVKDGEYQTLRKEAERLKLGLASSLSRKLHRYAGCCDINDSEMFLQTLDWNKLHL